MRSVLTATVLAIALTLENAAAGIVVVLLSVALISLVMVARRVDRLEHSTIRQSERLDALEQRNLSEAAGD